ncbi:MAG: hypothetical protein CVU11_13585 [Bacteroidetes bacterium HGW-Bacteroidetes-6]|nr:MAG: hypothetical protein CVU11_13585 [Bacteroidetes bacterium HGW-Bacteroidetes-6]
MRDFLVFRRTKAVVEVLKRSLKVCFQTSFRCFNSVATVVAATKFTAFEKPIPLRILCAKTLRPLRLGKRTMFSIQI